MYYYNSNFLFEVKCCNNILDMACFVQIFIYTTVYSEIEKDKIPYLPTQKLKNKSETDIFSRPNIHVETTT